MLTPEAQRLNNKSVIVTGGSSGIGRAISQLFAEHGANVMIADIDEPGGYETVSLIKSVGGQAIYQRTDVANPHDTEMMASVAVQNFKRIDILVNNAAAFVFGRIDEASIEDWQKVLGVNVIGYVNCIKSVTPIMRELERGSIINMASQSGFIAEPGSAPYNTSKGAILQITRTAAMDLAPIRVNSICPGDIKTTAIDRYISDNGLDSQQVYAESAAKAVLKRMGEPKEIAYGALFLASDESSYVTGTHLIIDGGATID